MTVSWRVAQRIPTFAFAHGFVRMSKMTSLLLDWSQPVGLWQAQRRHRSRIDRTSNRPSRLDSSVTGSPTGCAEQSSQRNRRMGPRLVAAIPPCLVVRSPARDIDPRSGDRWTAGESRYRPRLVVCQVELIIPAQCLPLSVRVLQGKRATTMPTSRRRRLRPAQLAPTRVAPRRNRPCGPSTRPRTP